MRWQFVLLFVLFAATAGAQTGGVCKIIVQYDDVLKDERFIIPHVTVADKQLQSAIDSVLLPENYTGLTIDELHAQEAGQVKDSTADKIYKITPEVKYNANCLLSLHIQVISEAVIMSATEGAYPVTDKYFTFDLNNGRQLAITDIIRRNKMAALLQLLNKKLKSNYLLAKKEYKDIYKVNGYEGYAFTEEDLDRFYFDKTGIAFRYDFHFMRCDQAYEPDGMIHLSKAELKSLVRDMGFVR